MNYPDYKHKSARYIGRFVLLFVIANYILSLIFPWYTYVHGSFLLLIMSHHILKKYKGFKAFSGIMFSILLMLLIFDFKDFEFTWSLDYVFPSFLIFMSLVLLVMVLLKKSQWQKHHDIHIYILLLNLVMIILMFLNIIATNVIVIITYSVLLFTIVLLRLRLGKNYNEDIDKFTHF